MTHNGKAHRRRPMEMTNMLDEDGVLIKSPDEATYHGNNGAHASGTPGGGTSVGGLAGTNIGDAAPGNADIDDALGSGSFDQRDPAAWPSADREDHVETDEDEFE